MTADTDALVRVDDARAWLHEFLGCGECNGWVCLALSLRGVWDPGELPPFRVDRPPFQGLVPDHGAMLADLARSLVQEADKGLDVFASPYLHESRSGRRKGGSVDRSHLHADIDGPLDLARVRELGGMAVASGSLAADGRPRGHVYLRLSGSVPLELHQRLCHAFGQRVGGEHHDAGKVNDNDVLRPPGTLNHKTDPPRPVTWLIRPDDPGVQTWDPAELAAVLGAGEKDQGRIGSTPAPRSEVGPSERDRRVDGLVRSVADAPVEDGNKALYWAARIAGYLDATPQQREALVRAYLARPSSQHTRAEAEATIRSGWGAGHTEVPGRAAPPILCGSGHDRPSVWCLDCRRLTDEVNQRWEAEQGSALVDMWVDGGVLFDLPQVIPLWGTVEDGLLAAVGQAWMICAGNSLGKTTLGSEYVKARLGLDGWAGEMWGLPVVPLAPDERVIYLAMDRTLQIQQSLARGGDIQRHGELPDRLKIHKGPPPYRLSGDVGQQWLIDFVEEFNAKLVVIDARKDLGSTIEADAVAGIALIVQLLTTMGVEVLILAHPNERRRKGPPQLSDISGFADVYNGLGSVLFLDGETGAAGVTVHHLKPLRGEPLPPFQVFYDKEAGRSTRGLGIVAEHNKEGGGTELKEGRMPVDAKEIRVLACIDANGGAAPSSSVRSILGLGEDANLSRELKALKDAGVVRTNGKNGPQVRWERGPNAPGSSPA